MTLPTSGAVPKLGCCNDSSGLVTVVRVTSVLLWPGTVGPSAGTPPRIPGSVRRTSSVDALRPDGLEGPLILVGRARDIRTTADRRTTDSDPELVAEASTRVAIDYFGQRLVTAVSCEPATAGTDTLVGTRAGSGFRTALDRAVPQLTADGTLLGLLLDEVPVVTLISGSAIARVSGKRPRNTIMPPTDVCAGWKAGGVMDVSQREGRFALLGIGPSAPALEDATDPLGWHTMPDLPPGSIRRRRRIDVVPGPQHGAVTVEGLFRDTFCEADGTQKVIHEYAVRATVDLATGTIRSTSATPHVLPGPDCPVAAASASRLVGQGLLGLRDVLRADLAGPTTCTHLTDQLRALADMHALIPLLP